MSEEHNAIRYDDLYDDEIDIIALIKTWISNWKSLLQWAGVGLILGVLSSITAVKTYTVNTKMAPEVSVRTSSSSLGALSSLAGVSLPGVSSTDAVHPDIYPDIVASTPFRVDMFSLPVEFKHRDEKVSTDLYDYIAHYTKTPWYSVVLSLPNKAIGAAKRMFKGKIVKVEGYENVNPYELTREQAMVAKTISESVTLGIDKKTGAICTSVTMQDPHVAAAVATEVMDRLQQYVVEYRTGKSRHDLKYYEQLRDSAKEDYYNAQQKYARYVDANQGVVLQRVRIEQERLQNEANLKYQLYNQTEQQVQAAKAKVQQETPVCTVIQPASVPRSSSPSTSKILFVCIFLCVVLDSVWILWGKDFLKKLKEPQEEQ